MRDTPAGRRSGAEAGGPRSDSYDVVVVGAGLGGLSAAALLSKAGKTVLVVEQAEALGGYAHAIERGQYKFDPAVHVFAEGQPGALPDHLFQFLGVQELVTLMPVEGFYKAAYPELTVELPRGFEEFAAVLADRFPREAAAITSFIELARKVHWQGHNLPARLDMADMGAAATANPELFKCLRATLQDVLDEYFEDPRLKSVLGTHWPYFAVPPSRLSAVVYMTVTTVFLEHAHYARGTFESFVEAFATAIERHGGELVRGTPVTRILVQDGRVAGVELDGAERVRASAVVSNADALATFEDLVGEEHVPRRFMSKIRRMRPSLSAVVVFVATTLDLGELGAEHEVFRPLHFEHDRSYEDIMAGRPGGMWAAVPTLMDRSLAPAGEHAMTLTSLAPYDIGKPWDSELDPYVDEVLVAYEATFPGLRDSITFLEAASPLTLERYCRNQAGAIYGWENTPAQSGGRRTQHVTPVEGLVLAGHWTQPGTGSVRVIVSGMHAAELALKSIGSDGSGFEHPDYPPI